MNDTQLLMLATELRKPDYATNLASRNYAAIAETLNAPVITGNPDDTPTEVPVEITLKMLLSFVPATEAAKIYGLGTYVTDLKIAIDAGDREYMAYLLSVALAANAISAETAEALQPLLTAKVTVPAPETISLPGIAGQLGLPVVSMADVQLAAHRYLGQ